MLANLVSTAGLGVLGLVWGIRGEKAALDLRTDGEAFERVFATVETEPVDHPLDAADDPAIWINPGDPARSVIIGTDKKPFGGLYVYDLGGNRLQFMQKGALNNVDLREGFPLAGKRVPLVTAGNRDDNTIAIFALDTITRTLQDVAAGAHHTVTVYGSCMYRSPVTGKYYYFVDSKKGELEQWELFESVARPGKVAAVRVRTLPRLSSQPEACVVDDLTGKLYVGEEKIGVWEFDAEPTSTSGPGFEGVLIASTAPAGHLVPEVEGLAIARMGADEAYLFVSNQGASTFSVFRLGSPHVYLKTFSVSRGPTCIDEVTGSDGIEVTTVALGPAFPRGVFVTQDDENDSGHQNFKLVPLEQILDGAGKFDDSACY